jgi:hypothetical protein
MRLLIHLLLFVITCPLITPILSAKSPPETSASAEGLRKWTNTKNQDITASLARITRLKSDKKIVNSELMSLLSSKLGKKSPLMPNFYRSHIRMSSKTGLKITLQE